MIPVFIYFLSPIVAIPLDQSNNQTNFIEIKPRNQTLLTPTLSEDKSNLISVQSLKEPIHTVDTSTQETTSADVQSVIQAPYIVVSNPLIPHFLAARTLLQTPYLTAARSRPLNYYPQLPQQSFVQPQTYYTHSTRPQSYYSPQDAFFRLLNPFVFPSSPGLTCVGVACNQNNVGGASGVETCVGGNCNQNNGRKKASC